MLLISGKYRILQQLGKQSLKRVGSLLCKPCIISLPVFIFLFSLKSYGSAGQNPIVDSLQNRLLSETDDSVRLILMLELGYQDERISLDTSLKVYCEGLEYARKISRPDFEARFLNSLGIVYRSQSDFPKAIEYFQSSLSVYEKISQSPVATMTLAGKKGMAICLLNIGNVHNNQKSYDKALEYYRKAVVINENIVEDGLGDPEVRRRLASCYNNIGIALKNLRRLEESLENYKKVIPIYEELRFAGGLASCYGNIAILCNEMGDYDCSVEYNLKALGIFERSGDKLRATIILGNLASMEESRKNYNFAVAYAEKSLKLAEETGAVLSQKYACEHLSKAWEGLGNIAKAFEYHKRYFILNDSIFNEEKNRQVEEMEAKYQNEKKQQEIEKQQLLLEKKEVEIKQKEAEAKQERTQKIAFVAGFIFMLVLALLIFLSYRQKKKANRILAVQKQQIAEKNEELLQLNEEIVAQRDQIEIQKNLVTEQRDRIEFIHEELTDSIQYAKYIQEALLPKREMLDCMFGDYFILFQPKDIVSGDFYWATTVFVPGSRDARPYVSTAGTKILVVAVADCTGHGVPGAFMSMLGISLLNEIVRKREVTTASQVLDILRERVISSLQQNNIRGEQKDGMDIALVAIDTESLVCQYAGANNPLYIVKNTVNCVDTHSRVYLHNNDNQINQPDPPPHIIEIKADKQPVAIHPDITPFTNHEFNLQHGDKIYLFTDGFTDQFGGSKGKKFKSGAFRDMIAGLSGKSMPDQGAEIECVLRNWMNPPERKSFEQLDDITIVGIRI